MGALSADTVRIVKITAPVLQVHGDAIVARFYSMLFEQHPEAAAFFNVVPSADGDGGRGQSRTQIKRLSMAVLFYADAIDRVDTLGPVLDRISSKHMSRGIPAAFYPAVGSCLLGAIGDVLGDAATPEIVGAWTEAYGFLADALMATEAKMAARLAAAPGGWTDYAPFEVAAASKEAVPPPGRAVSLTLRPLPSETGPAVTPEWKAGQYIGLRLPASVAAGGTALLDGEAADGAVVRRTLFITSLPGPGADLRVTLVAGPGVPADPVLDGLMDVKVGTPVEVSAPLGSFTWDSPILGTHLPTAPVVFVASEAGLPEVATLVRTALADGRAVTLVRLVDGAAVGGDAAAAEQLLGGELRAAGVAAGAAGGDLRQMVVPSVGELVAAVGEGVAADAEFFVASTPPELAGQVRKELVEGHDVPAEHVLHAGYVPA